MLRTVQSDIDDAKEKGQTPKMLLLGWQQYGLVLGEVRTIPGMESTDAMIRQLFGVRVFMVPHRDYYVLVLEEK